ncbi:MAG TPA: hypothetical protein PLQ68_04460 [Clostridia bacterium]|nr:hypothetical protein [Clostridia bacterium]
MEVTSDKRLTIFIELNENEADWLMTFIQNHPDLEHENQTARDIRIKLFNELRMHLDKFH